MLIPTSEFFLPPSLSSFVTVSLFSMSLGSFLFCNNLYRNQLFLYYVYYFALVIWGQLKCLLFFFFLLIEQLFVGIHYEPDTIKVQEIQDK